MGVADAFITWTIADSPHPPNLRPAAYRQRRFKLVFNPAAGIRTELKAAGTRRLDEDEWGQLYRWLECPTCRCTALPTSRVADHAVGTARKADYRLANSKNNRPYAIHLPGLAVELVGSIVA